MKHVLITILLLGSIGCSKSLPTSDLPDIVYTPVSEVLFNSWNSKLVVNNLTRDDSNSKDGAMLAYTEAYTLHDMIDRFEYDGSYQNEIEAHISNILNTLSTSVYDELRHRYLRGFITTAYTNGVAHAWLFHLVCVLDPITRYYSLIHKDPNLPEIMLINSVLSDYDSEWDGKTYTMITFNKQMPYNMGYEVARTFYYMYQLTNAPVYDSRMKSILQLQKDGIFTTQIRGSTYYNWSYDPSYSRIEDADHGVREVLSVIFFSTKGIVFTDFDRNQVLRLYFEVVIRDSGVFNTYLDGRNDDREHITVKQTCKYALQMYMYNPELFSRCESL